MKKLITIFTVIAMICLFSFTALAANSNADWGTTVTVDTTDGSVTVSADATKIIDAEGLTGVAWLYVLVFDDNQNYTADSDIIGVANSAIVGPGNVGRVGNDLIYNITVGATDATIGQYNFQEGQDYYIYILACDGVSVWAANYQPYVLNYSTSGDTEPAATDAPTTTGDFSTIAYAMVALVSGSALTLFRKKK